MSRSDCCLLFELAKLRGDESQAWLNYRKSSQETTYVMNAICWYGVSDVRTGTVPDPKIKDPRDAIIKITAAGICGSDLHLLDGFTRSMKSGDVVGHKPMGIVVEVGSAVKNIKKGFRVAGFSTAILDELQAA